MELFLALASTHTSLQGTEAISPVLYMVLPYLAHDVDPLIPQPSIMLPTLDACCIHCETVSSIQFRDWTGQTSYDYGHPPKSESPISSLLTRLKTMSIHLSFLMIMQMHSSLILAVLF